MPAEGEWLLTVVAAEESESVLKGAELPFRDLQATT